MPPSRLRRPILLTATVAGLAGSVLTGCGGPASGAGIPHAATAPPVSHAPAGTVVALPGDPGSLAVDDKDSLLAAGVNRGVALISTATGHEQKVVDLASAPDLVTTTRYQQTLLVPLAKAGQLVQLTLPSGQVAAETHVAGQPDAAADASSNTVFVSDGSASKVSLVQNGQQVAEEPVPHDPGGVATSRDGTEVVVLGTQDRRLEAFSYSGRSLGSTPAGAGPTHVVGGANDLFYVSDTKGNAIDVFQLGSGPREVAAVPTRRGAPYGLALDSTRNILYVTLTASNELESFRVKGTTAVPARVWPTVRQPDSVAVDSTTGRVFVASRTGGGLELIDP